MDVLFFDNNNPLSVGFLSLLHCNKIIIAAPPEATTGTMLSLRLRLSLRPHTHSQISQTFNNNKILLLHLLGREVKVES